MRTGGHIRCLELMEGLAQRGHRVTVLLNSALEYAPRHFSEIRLAASYTRKSLPPASMVFRWATEAWLEAGGLTERPDFVLIFGEVHFHAAIAVKKRFRVPILLGLQSNIVRETLISMRENVFRPHMLARSLFDLLHYRQYEARIARACDVIVFQSGFDRDDFLSRNRHPAGRSFVIRGNIGLPRFTEENRGLNKSTALNKILFMGNLGERKGLRYLFEAFDILRVEGRRGLELHIAGPGTGEQRAWFEQYALKHGFAGEVTFYGRVPSAFPLMSECDITVVPSLFDSYPDVVLESLHVGIPVIGSRTGGIPDMLVYDDLLFPLRDSAAIASILRRCLDAPGHYAELRTRSAQRREGFLFDWPAAWESAATEAFRSLTGAAG